MVKPGQRLEVLKGYSVRAFRMQADEPLGGTYTAFERAGREPRLVQLGAGAALVAVTDSNADGYVYAQHLDDGSPWACVLLPDSYKVG